LVELKRFSATPLNANLKFFVGLVHARDFAILSEFVNKDLVANPNGLQEAHSDTFGDAGVGSDVPTSPTTALIARGCFFPGNGGAESKFTNTPTDIRSLPFRTSDLCRK